MSKKHKTHYQLISIDKETGQPTSVHALKEGGILDLNDIVQRHIYTATINDLTPNTEVKATKKGDVITIRLNHREPTQEPAVIVETYEPPVEDK